MIRIAVAIALGATALAAPAAQREDREAAQLERRLRGLTPGPARECISPSFDRGQIRTGDRLLIEDRSGVLHLTRFADGCRMRTTDAIIRRSGSTRICRGDIVEAVDPVTNISTGACSYSAFVPYRKPR